MQMSEVEIEANHSPGHSVEFINKANRKQVLSTAGYFVHLASQTASVSFEIAKSSTKFGIGVGRTIVHELGAYTGLELPSAILSSTLSVAEFIAITSIETSRFWTDFGIGTAKFNLEILSFLFGSSDVANGITEFINLVQRLGALHDTETGIPISSAELLRGLTAWVQIQKCTEAEYKSIMWDPVMTCIASCSKESVKFTPSDENRALETIELISNIKHHVLYAGASYGDTGIAFMWSKLPFSSNSLWLSHRNHHAFAEHTKSSVDDVYHTSYANHIDHSVYHPKFYIVLDHEKRNVGTLSMHDLFVDLTCEYDTIKISGQDVKVHSGMYKSAVNLTDPAHPTSVFLAVKSALTKHEGYGLLLTGHSLGAAIASYLALIWGDENTCSTRENSGLPLGRLVKCFAFGPPCVVSLNGSKLLKKLVTSITVESDLVCRLSLGSAIDMLNIAKWMNRNRNVADPIISAIFKQKEIKCTPELIQTRISVEAQFAKEEKLFPAGELYYIDQKEICRVDRIDVLFGILILSNGINKHMPNYYDGLFKDM